MPQRYEIEEEQWNRIKHLFPIAKTGCPAKWDNKIMFNGIPWLARSGSAWKDLPSHYPPHQSVYSRFCKWRENGTFEKIFKKVQVQKKGTKFRIQTTHRKQLRTSIIRIGMTTP